VELDNVEVELGERVVLLELARGGGGGDGGGVVMTWSSWRSGVGGGVAW